MNVVSRILVKGEIKPGFAENLRSVIAPYYDQSTVEIHIDSNGGNACEGLAAANVIKKRGNVDVVVINAASAATFLVAAAANRLITPKGKMLIHTASIPAGPTPENQKILAALNARMLALYAERTTLPAMVQRQILSGRDYEYDANTAVDYRLCDLVICDYSELSTNYDHIIQQ